MPTNPLPIWLQPTTLDRWRAVPFASDALRISLGIPEDWQPRATLSPGPYDTLESSWRGATAADHLAVACMTAADPAADQRAWVEAPLSLTGDPMLGTGDEGISAELLAWETAPLSSLLAEHFRVDEAHAWLGVALLTVEDRPLLARTWILVARRATTAWRIVLSVNTALPPGAEPAMIDSNDHRRAAVILGALHFS